MCRILIVASSLIFATGCATVYNPATQRQEFVFIDSRSEASLGKNLSQEIEKNYEVSKDARFNKILQDTGQRVARFSDRQDIEYHFAVLDNPEINAFALPGGYVYVFSGLMSAATQDELACVLGHEIGHIAARHGAKRMQALYGYQLVRSIAFGESRQDMARAMDAVANVIVLGYSRQDELEADRLGVRYARRAGYDPEAMIAFLRNLEKRQEERGYAASTIGVFLSSHPPVETRVNAIREEISRPEDN